MRPLLSFIALVVSLALSASASLYGRRGVVARHHAVAELVARQASSDSTAKRPRKRCSAQGNSTVVNNLASNNATKPANKPANKPNDGILQKSGACGSSRAQQQISAVAGPNGHIDWLNCGIEDSGWKPPRIDVHELKTVTLDAALKPEHSVFSNCKPFREIFNQAARDNDLPPILLASFAMQESSCKPETVGGGGEQGLMQITQEKCKNAPGGNCKDPYYNINTAARYFKKTLDGNGGDFLRSLGQYNGWPLGMTHEYATRAKGTGCCRCQNNLDYLHQFVNGWCQGINAYGNPRLGRWFNLDVCNL